MEVPDQGRETQVRRADLRERGQEEERRKHKDPLAFPRHFLQPLTHDCPALLSVTTNIQHFYDCSTSMSLLRAIQDVFYLLSISQQARNMTIEMSFSRLKGFDPTLLVFMTFDHQSINAPKTITPVHFQYRIRDSSA